MAERLGGSFAGLFPGAVMHTPVGVTEEAVKRAADVNADGVVAVGGGSTIGLGKAISRRTGLPQIAIPTTYAGSEMTPILGETQDGAKTTRSSPEIMPNTVIYDVDLTLSLPVRIAAVSGMNALAHSVEALYAKDRNPVVSLVAADAIRAMVGALPDIAREPDDRDARSRALYGAWLSGTLFWDPSAWRSITSFATSSAEPSISRMRKHTRSCCRMRWPTTALRRPRSKEASPEILGAPGSAAGLFDFACRLGIPASLREIGMPQLGIDQAADLAMANPYWNPRPLDRPAIRELIANAWAGRRPL